MPTARKCQICLDETPYYHIVSRIVRRSFLCGEDPLSGKNYDHRRDWVEEWLLLLTSIFAIEISAFAVMSNHTHLVLCVDKDRALKWSRDEVLGRWHQLHKGTLLTQKYSRGESLLATELEIVNATCEVYRNRLTDISWFMRELNEYIAREANKEDQCTGRFWEGRFKSQALLDEKALFVANPKQELQLGLQELEQNPVFRQRFQNFVTPMVFNTEPHDFDTCLASFKSIAVQLISKL